MLNQVIAQAVTMVEVGNTTLQSQVLLRMVIVANELFAAGGADSVTALWAGCRGCFGFGLGLLPSRHATGAILQFPKACRSS